MSVENWQCSYLCYLKSIFSTDNYGALRFILYYNCNVDLAELKTASCPVLFARDAQGIMGNGVCLWPLTSDLGNKITLFVLGLYL